MQRQSIYDIAELCALKGITEAVLCPGSRCAPLTIAFARNSKINARTFSDERSAAFIANGLALASDNPVAIVCTSGSAAYNLAPAIAEAFFQHIPLLVLTADRPKEWINQLDGQTIDQAGIYGSHVKASYELPQDDHADSAWFVNRTINEAINLSNRYPKGPVHVNIPLREPLYPAEGEQIQFSSGIRVIEEKLQVPILTDDLLTDLQRDLKSSHRMLIVAGQEKLDSRTSAALEQFSQLHSAPVIADIISNQHIIQNIISHSDLFLGACTPEIKAALRPQLLITFGKSVVSKNLKIFLRQHRPVKHWHIQPGGYVADTFQSLTSILPVTPFAFFDKLNGDEAIGGFDAQKRVNYTRLWEAEERKTVRTVNSFFATPSLNEFHLVSEVLKNIPAGCNLHIANSMSIRYANFIGLDAMRKNIEVYCNRGTSGIDGSTSTAVGHALATKKPTIVITGDMALLYDRNAFWHNYKIPNLRVVVLNNHGGAIFSMIDGPSHLPEADEYFVTDQKASARFLALERDFDYLKLDNLKKMKNLLKDFFEFDGRTKLLEIESTPREANAIMTGFKNQIKKIYETSIVKEQN